mgnify:FL=1
MIQGQNMLAKAISLAAKGHELKLDKGGKPYILHPLRIMLRLRTEDQELMSIAVLHDLIEDTKTTFTDLLMLGFSDRVLTALKALTHQPGVSYEDYIEIIAENPDARRVKTEDLRDNSDITRLKGLEQSDFERLAKYAKAYQRLTQEK